MQLEILILASIVGAIVYQYRKNKSIRTQNDTDEKISAKLDFDELVELKKKELSQFSRPNSLTEQLLEKGRAADLPKNDPKAKTLAAYLKEQDYLKNSGADELLLKTNQEMLKVIRGLEWGGGEELSEISRTFSQAYALPIDRAKLYLYLKEVIHFDLLLAFKSPFLPSKEELSRILMIYSGLKYLVQFQNDPSAFGPFCARKSLPSHLLMDSLRYILSSEKNEESFRFALEDQTLIGEAQIAEYIYQEKGKIRSMAMLVEDLREASLLFMPLRPLEIFEINQESALKILGLSDHPDLDQINKRYRTMAKIFHPDRIESLKLGEKYSKLAHDNFLKVKEAYELLKVNCG